MTHCRYHCRGCGSHFASLEAFDAHRTGTPQDRACTFPDDSGLVEIPGAVCAIAGAEARVGVTLYSTERAARARETFKTRAERQALGTKLREAA